MMSPDHPNAQWLSMQYRGALEIERDATVDEPTKARLVGELMQRVFANLAPTWTIHTGGNRLAATGDINFAAAYNLRRFALTNGTFGCVEIDEIAADDNFGLVRGTFRAQHRHGAMAYDAMGTWRFENGFAVEHWEHPPGPEFDAFFLAADPAFDGGTAEEFWTRA